jgi:hypothetical protein
MSVPGSPYSPATAVPYAQPPARQVTTLPRPQTELPKPDRLPSVEMLPQPEQTAALQIVVPPPAELGIRLDDPAPSAIVVPSPEKLGIFPD